MPETPGRLTATENGPYEVTRAVPLRRKAIGLW